MAHAKKSPLIIDHPWEYEVIGEHQTDPLRLLVLGSDGRLYALSLLDGDTSPMELSDEWVLDVADLHAKLQRVTAA